MIGIINYGMGNLASVRNALEHLSIPCKIVTDATELREADKLILPGVGAFGMAMDNLNRSGLSDEIRELVLVKKKPILGICLGMQLLLDQSVEHGVHNGLSIVNGEVLFFGEVVKDQPIPHMGWNDVEVKNNAVLFNGIESPSSYYFVHSYYCALKRHEDVAAVTDYGINFHSSIESGHIFGCQFHPEKSQQKGLCIFKNFNSL
ncbi:imidazole glycerol phosphate synthase subunit HisH [Terrimonas sp. NA20]|uniref:Imidazole glycerol phosphate synthase subunit HisH n=1 Tax=Terrimonas ginsenosidimutans TaxID=2908004 RepID=A0ABS9KUZ7_9BACT|nr:imidazole glycerol phosphate synthase subunit HisH [Terrimonas ginsenosidimutans]MCG2616074.1 imidazole glycerol phosphate synthase subunit HisH [Terrimonas ginsenosidimutans]